MAISLTRVQIDKALPSVGYGLKQYLWLQGNVADQDDFHTNTTFRRRYNHFYRVRRGSAWQEVFYALMARAKKEKLPFHMVLDLLYQETDRYEASFASKLAATIDASQPVIDSIVLDHLGLRLPYATASDRMARICAIQQNLVEQFAEYLGTDSGKYLIAKFKQMYPTANITEVKMLDLVLAKSRD
jgi:hypothetical protein